MFIIFFAIFVFISTVRENIRIGIISFAWIVLILSIHSHVNKNREKQTFLIILLAFILSLWSFLLKNNFSLKDIQQPKSFMWTGIITDTSTAWKYVFTTATASYLLQSKQSHIIGEELFLVGKLSSWTFSGSGWDQWFLSFDYAKWIQMKWRAWLLYESNSSVLHTNQAWWLSQIKQTLQQKVVFLYGKDRISGLILWMLIGDRSLIPKDDYQQFINSWLVHLIAVSGGNLVMITVFLWLVLFFLPFYLRSGVILLAIIFYGLLCGLDSSVFRAVITWGLSLLALFRGREIPIWRLLSIAFIAMLLINPYYLVYDVGFLMSFWAVIWIILLSQNKGWELKISSVEGGDVVQVRSSIIEKTTKKILSYIRKNYLQPSVGATLGIFPIIMFFMGQLNLLSIIGNLFVLPIIPFVMIYGFASIFLFQLFHWQWLLLIEKMLILYIYKVSELCSSFGLYLLVQDRAKRIVLLGFLTWFILWRSGNLQQEKKPVEPKK